MKASIVIPTLNGAETLGRCLEAVFAQRAPFPFDVLVIDSGSTDGTRAIAGRFPVRVRVIDRRDFDHGDTRNLGALLTDGDVIAFLVQDAWPASTDWLQALVACFDDPAVAGAYCRVLPRPDASLFARRAAEADLCHSAERRVARITDRAGWACLSPEERRVFVDFNDVASALRRSVWQRLPFARTPFGEDLLWARGALEAGHAIVFEPAAAVHHSHEYEPAAMRRRARIDAWFNRAHLDRVNVPGRLAAVRLANHLVREDLAAMRAAGLQPGPRELPRLLRHRWALADGFREGGLTTERRPTPCAVRRDKLRVLQVVHGFPPSSIAGTEVFTAALSRELVRRGHEVAVLHPAPGIDELVEDDDEGLRVFRFGPATSDVGADECRPDALRAFVDTLARFRPDVVHFQHLIHLSPRLPRAAREAGIPSIVTLADYWFRCRRVQLLRADGRPCTGPPPGALACAACLSGRTAGPGLRTLSALAAVPVRAWANRAGSGSGSGPRRELLAGLVRRRAAIADGLAAASFVISPSHFVRERALEAGLAPDRVVVCDYGFERTWATAVPAMAERAPEGPLRVGFTGSLVAHKGLTVLARAVRRLGDPRVELHVHGDASGSPEAAAIAAEVRALVPAARLHGRFDPSQRAAVFAGLDVLVVPSVWFENSPLAVHEAFLARRPVLVSDLGGLRELVADGRGGLRFRAGDADDLAAVLRRLLDEPGLGPRLAAAAPPVKDVAECAAEMEVKYRQAIGLLAAEAGT
ncbi:MAG: glycosyltransferase [Vicinamibacteria bacterium]|nr:glycosyltransferase [Vicinamibacteria bacterium]